MKIRNKLGFAIMKLGHALLDSRIRPAYGLAVVIGQCWMMDNKQQAEAILSGDACLMPVPGALKGMIKEAGEMPESGHSIGFGTKH